MTNEEVIRDEAKIFSKRNEPRIFEIPSPDHHKIFKENLQRELSNFYKPEDKMIFLDETMELSIILRNKYLQLSNNGTDNKDSFWLTQYNKILFFIQQEIDELPSLIKKSDFKVSENRRTKVFVSYCHADTLVK